MDIDYQAKYLLTRSLCKKHEATIAKLQAEIRERCQSYLLYSSRNKKANIPELNDLSQVKSEVKSIVSHPSLEQSRVQAYTETPEVKQFQEGTENKPQIVESHLTQSKPKTDNFVITAQLSLISQGSPSPKPKKQENEDSKEAIVQSYKERIGRINQEKTKYAKIAEKNESELRQAHRTIAALQKRIETMEKTQKKLKIQVTKIGEFQGKIHKIYQQIYYKLNFKKEIDPQDLTSFNQKLQFLLTLVSESCHNLGKGQECLSISNDPTPVNKRSSDSSDSSNGQSSSHSTQRHEIQKRNPNSYDAKIQKRPCQSINLDGKISKFSNSISLENVGMAKDKKINASQNILVSQFKDDGKEALESAKRLQQVQRLYQSQIEQLNNRHVHQLEELKKQLEAEKQRYSLLQNQRNSEQNGLECKYNRLAREVESKEDIIMTLNNELQTAKEELSQSKIKLMENSLEIDKYKENLQNSRHLEESYNKTKEELDKSRSIIDDLEHSKLNKEINDLKEISAQKSRDQKKGDLTDSQAKIVEQLEEPYYVQEQLYHDPKDEYVKRSFIRKKIVRRNFSATAYRVVSKSKEEVEFIIRSKVRNISDRSLEKKEKMKESLMTEKQSMKTKDPNSRISEVSAQNRESDYMMEDRDVIKIVEVTTKTPKEEISTTKISSKNGEEVKAIRKKQK